MCCMRDVTHVPTEKLEVRLERVGACCVSFSEDLSGCSVIALRKDLHRGPPYIYIIYMHSCFACSPHRLASLVYAVMTPHAQSESAAALVRH